MVQNMQNISDETRLITRPARSVHSGVLVPQIDTLRVISCPICRAIYMPASQPQGGAQNSSPALEAAFLHVCHFCFRCQKPACPQCWNHEQNLCAACSNAAKLAFRSPLSSFEGLIFSPPAFPHAAQTSQLSFACLRNGQFYQSEQSPAEAWHAGSLLAPAAGPVEGFARPDSPSPSPAPHWFHEFVEPKPVYQLGTVSQQLDEPVAHSMLIENALTLPQTSSLDCWKHLAPSIQEPAVEVGPEVSLNEQPFSDDAITLIERIENTLIFVTSFILAVVVLMIVVAICSADMNAFFLRLMHIDIRVEIAYLLQLL